MQGTANTAALEALRRRLAGKDPPRVVAAVGPEAWLRDEALRVVAEAVLGAADSPNLITIRGDDSSESGAAGALGAFFDEARTSSLFGGAKVVALRDAEKAASEDPAAFAAWLQNPSRGVTVVLLAGELKADHLTAAKKSGVVVECGSRWGSGADPARFVAQRAASRGKRISTDDAADLVHLVGDDLGSLENAVEILALHAGDEPAIAPAAIRALFPGAGEGDADAFASRLLQGDVAAALTASSRCFDEGVPEAWGSRRLARDERSVAFVLLREFARTLQRVLDARRQLDAGVPRGSVELGRLPPRVRDAAVRMAAARRAEALDAIVLLTEETDRGMKSGGATGRVAIVRLATAIGRLR